MKNYIIIKKLNIKKDLDEINVDDSNNDHSKMIFDFSHQMTKRFPNEGDPNKVMNEILDYKEFDFNKEFDIIIFKTLLNEYIKYINTFVDQQTNIYASGVKRFFDSPNSKGSEEFNLEFINGLSRSPQIILDNSLLTKSKLLDFLANRGKELDISLEFDEEFLREKIKEGNEWFDKLKQSLQPKKWWKF